MSGFQGHASLAHLGPNHQNKWHELMRIHMMETAAFPLLALPAETLMYISELVHAIDRTSFYALARVNKHLNSIAAPILYHTITFTITDLHAVAPRQLRDDICHCRATLEARQLHRHVRRLVIQKAKSPRCWADYDPMLPNYSATRAEHFATVDAHRWQHAQDVREPEIAKWKRAFVKFHQHSEWGILGSGYLSLVTCGNNEHRPGLLDPDDAYFADEQWKPLAALLETLHALSDLVWNYPAQLPPCILQTVHTSLAPRCQLVMPKFRLQSLNATDGVDLHELAIVTSPSLSRISAEFEDTEGWNPIWYRTHGSLLPEYQDAALDKILRHRMAPNLTWLRVADNIDVRFWLHEPRRHQQRRAPPWNPPPEFLGDSATTPKTDDDRETELGTKLEYLELDGQEFAPGPRYRNNYGTPIRPLRRSIELENIEQWRARVDFSCLKTLNLIRPPTTDALASLMPGYTGGSPLPNLTSLTIAERQSPGEDPSSDYMPFIASLPKLENLRIIGWFFDREGISITNAFPQQDPAEASGEPCSRLETLLLQPKRPPPRRRQDRARMTPDMEEIDQLLARLPNLREFSLPMLLGPTGELFPPRMQLLRESVRRSCPRMSKLSILTVSDANEMKSQDFGFLYLFHHNHDRAEDEALGVPWEELVIDTGLVDLPWKPCGPENPYGMLPTRSESPSSP